MSRFKGIITFALFNIIVLGFVQAQDTAGKYFVSKDNVAIEGYDVVGYFTQNKASKGSKKHSSKFEGITYYFSSEENKETFQKNPGKYLPQYGGWCAFAMGAKNTKFTPDPKTFKLYNGKLLLFYNGEHGNTSIPWNNDEENTIMKADANWSKISKN